MIQLFGLGYIMMPRYNRRTSVQWNRRIQCSLDRSNHFNTLKRIDRYKHMHIKTIHYTNPLLNQQIRLLINFIDIAIKIDIDCC